MSAPKRSDPSRVNRKEIAGRPRSSWIALTSSRSLSVRFWGSSLTNTIWVFSGSTRVTRPSSDRWPPGVDFDPTIAGLIEGIGVVLLVGREPHLEQAPGRWPRGGRDDGGRRPAATRHAGRPIRRGYPAGQRNCRRSRSCRLQGSIGGSVSIVFIIMIINMPRARATEDAETAPAVAACPALKMDAAHAVARTTDTATGRGDIAIANAASVGASPRRSSLPRSRSRPRACRLLTVPTGHPSRGGRLFVREPLEVTEHHRLSEAIGEPADLLVDRRDEVVLGHLDRLVATLASRRHSWARLRSA